MSERHELTEHDRELLEKIEEILVSGSGQEHEANSLYIFCAHLAATVPQADAAFQQRLETRLVEEVQQQCARTTRARSKVADSHQHRLLAHLPWGRVHHQTREQETAQRYGISGWRWALAGSLALLVLLGIVLAVPHARTALANWFGFSFERRETLLPLAIEADSIQAAGLADTSHEICTFGIPKERWALIEKAGFSTPKPGGRVPLPDGGAFPVPAYLPEGYRWQDLAIMNGDLRALGFPSLASQSGAGGGPPMPPYDRNIVNYLIGGNRADQFLLLAQFHSDVDQGLKLQVYHAVLPQQLPTTIAGTTPGSSPVPKPTPTRVSAYYAEKMQIGIIIQPAKGQKGLTFLVGPGELHETTVNKMPARWYQGTWNATGEWTRDEQWINLVWEQGGMIYHLSGQELSLEDVVHMAGSLP